MRPFFLLGLNVYGIKNIEKPLEFTFYKKVVNKNFDPNEYRIKAIYGENGSGKTAIMTAVLILKNIILDKNYLYESVTQRNLIELINKKTRCATIGIEYVNEGIRGLHKIYKYEVELRIDNENRVYISRELFQSKKEINSYSKYNKIYETKDGDLIYFDNKKNITQYQEDTKNLLKQRAFPTFITTFLNPENVEDISFEILFVLTLFMFAISINVYIDDADDHRNYVNKLLLDEFEKKDISDTSDIIHSAQDVLKSELYKDVSNNIIPKEHFDLFENEVKRKAAFIRMFKPELIGIEVEKKDYSAESYKYNLKMNYPDYSIDSEYESNGIKKLMGLFGSLDVACSGSIVFIDELDSNINDVYLNKIIEYFMIYGEGQLCFTAHNLSPMSVLKKNKLSISFISSANTVHTWTRNGNQTPENAYRDGFIEDSPFNVDVTDFLGVLGEYE